MAGKMKNAFSLIEVMVIFVILSVVLAASMPVITRKSIPFISTKKHGIYKCVPSGNFNEDGKPLFRQEVWNTQRLVSNDEVTQCSFIPDKTASLFVVSIYSAGAGGTEYANFATGTQTNRTADITLDDVYTSLQDSSKDSITKNYSGSEIPFTLSYDVIKDYFSRNGLYNYITKSIHTGDAADGQDVRLSKYKTSSHAECTVVDDYTSKESAAKQRDSSKSTYIEKLIENIRIKVNSISTNVAYKVPSDIAGHDEYADSDDTVKEISEYCKDMYPEYYTKKNDSTGVPKPDGASGTITMGSIGDTNWFGLTDNAIDLRDTYNWIYYDTSYNPYRGAISHGGEGGLGTTISVKMNLRPDYYPSKYSNINGSPAVRYLTYFTDLYKNTIRNYHKQSFETVQCDKNSQGELTNCSETPDIADKSQKTEKKYDAINSCTNGICEPEIDYGDDQDKWAAIKIPSMYSFSGYPTYITLISELPTGGQSGLIEISEKSFDYSEYNNVKTDPITGTISVYEVTPSGINTQQTNENYASRYNSNQVKATVENTREPGNNVQLSSSRVDDDQGFYTIEENTSSEKYAAPRIHSVSSLYPKVYTLGKAGTAGSVKHFTKLSLGTNCTFDVPSGGRVLKYNDYPNPEALASEVRAREQALSATIACTKQDASGPVDVLRYRLPGGRYQTDFYTETKEYSDDELSNVTINPGGDEYNQPPLVEKLTAIFNNVVNSLFTGAHPVMSPGSGTVLVDKCTAPKGKQEFYSQLGTSDSSLENLYYGYYSILIPNTTVNKDGKKDGKDCYDPQLLTDTDLYTYGANDGGPGAVIITW